jgi:hypothetical protein
MFKPPKGGTTNDLCVGSLNAKSPRQASRASCKFDFKESVGRRASYWTVNSFKCSLDSAAVVSRVSISELVVLKLHVFP